VPGDFLPPLVGVLRLNNAQFMAATRESGAAMRKTQAEGKGAYATLGAGAEKALKAISVASGAAAVASLMLATKFDSAMERVHTQAGAGQAEVEKMSGAMLDLAPKVGTGPEKLAESLFHVESVGLRGAKALDTVAASAKLAKVGNADLEQTTNAVAAAFVTQMKDARSLNQIVGLLNATIGQGNMKMDDLTAAISTGILPVAKNFGLGLADVGGALAVMTDRGMHADEAATRLKMTMTMMEAPTTKAGKALHSVGLSSTSLAEDMHKPEGLLVALTDLKSHMDKAGLSAIKQAQVISAIFGGGRSSAGVQTLMNNLDALDQKTRGVTAGVDKFGEAWAKTQQTAKFQWDQLKASLESAGVKLGNVLLPSVLRIAGAVGKVADAFAHLPSGVQGTMVTVGLLAYPVMKVTKAILAGRDAWIAWRAEAAAAETTGAGLAGSLGLVGAAAAAGAYKGSQFAGQLEQMHKHTNPLATALDWLFTVTTIGGKKTEQAIHTAYEPANAAMLTGQHRALAYGDAQRKLGDGAKVATSALHAQHPAMVTIRNDVEKAIPLFGGVSHASQISANTILGNLRQERDQFRTWSADVRTLLARGLDPKIVQALSSQGPGYVHAFVHASDAQLRDLSTVFKQRTAAAGDAAKIEAAKKGAEAGAAAARAMERNFHPYLLAYSKIITQTVAGAPASTQRRYAGGGTLNEPVFGVGVRSGETYSFAENGPEVVVPLGGHGRGGGVGGWGGGIYVAQIVVQGADDPHRTAVMVRDELLKLGRRNPSVLSGLGVKA
jgi:TP901 family phage tail tape measure protein